MDALFNLLITILFTVNSVFILPERINEVNKDFNKYQICSLALNLIIFILMLINLKSEIYEIYFISIVKKNPSVYFKEIYNYFDWMVFIMCNLTLIVDIILIFNKQEVYLFLRVFHSISFVLIWIKMVSFGRGIEKMAFLIKMIIEVFLDMKYFLFLVFILLSVVSFAGFYIFFFYLLFYI